MGEVIAVGVLLEPGAAMVLRATEVNARLRGVYPDGFALDDAHRPHLTVIQGYFTADRLEESFAAIDTVLAGEPIASWTLTATGYYFIPGDGIGLAGIVVEPTSDLLRLQRSLLDAVAPFTVGTGSADAFVRPAEDPDINQPTIDYVGAFESAGAGDNYNPHITVGIATRDYLDAMLAEPFDPFTFSPVSAAAYQLANYGTAARRLHDWAPHA
jgi:hypothetical protein